MGLTVFMHTFAV